MAEIPKKPETIKSEKRVQLAIASIIIVSALGWGIVKGSHHQNGIKNNNIIKFANYDTDILIQEQKAFHEEMENKVNIIHSNLQNKMENEEKTNEFLLRKIELLEKQPPKLTIIKDKRSSINEKTDSLNVPSAY